MSENEVYQNLVILSKNKPDWSSNIPIVFDLLGYPSVKTKAKAIWMLGDMGYKHPAIITPYIAEIAKLLSAENAKIRERAVGALGRIGRSNFKGVSQYIDIMLKMANDNNSEVRMILIWACENIATNTPQAYEYSMDVFSKLLEDSAIRVRRESPEIFRVIGKRIPEYVLPYIEKLQTISENDLDRVVRAHALGAIRVTLRNIN